MGKPSAKFHPINCAKYVPFAVSRLLRPPFDSVSLFDCHIKSGVGVYARASVCVVDGAERTLSASVFIHFAEE